MESYENEGYPRVTDFALGSESVLGGGDGQSLNEYTRHYVRVPAWFLAALLAAWPASVFAHKITRFSRRARETGGVTPSHSAKLSDPE